MTTFMKLEIDFPLKTAATDGKGETELSNRSSKLTYMIHKIKAQTIMPILEPYFAITCKYGMVFFTRKYIFMHVVRS